MLVRYFADLTSGPVGKLACWWLSRALFDVPMLRLRLVSAGGPAELDGIWKPYTHLLQTPLEPTYMNVVCCESHRWCFDTEVGTVEIYTPGIRNVLIVPGPAKQSREGAGVQSERLVEPSYPPQQLASALKYEIVVVHPQDMKWWLEQSPKCLLASNNPRAVRVALG